MDKYICPQTTGTRVCVELKISPGWNVVNVIVKSKGARYQLDWDALKLRYGLSLKVQKDKHLLALSGSVLSAQFSKSVLELQLDTLDIIEVAYIRNQFMREFWAKNHDLRQKCHFLKILN